MRIIYSDNYKSIQRSFLDKCREIIEQKRKTVVIVPAQATALVERLVINHCGIRGLFEFRIMSFESLTDEMRSILGGRAEKVLDDSGFAMMTKLIIRNNAEKLKVINVNDSEIHLAMADIVSSFKSEQISVDTLKEARGELSNGLANKIDDISLIYEELTRLIDGKYIDSRDAEYQMLDRYRQTDYFRDVQFLVFGFDLITKIRIKTICELEKISRGVTVYTISDKDDYVLYKQNMNLYQMEKQAQEYDIKVEKEQLKHQEGNAVDFLCNNLYSYPFRTYKKPQNIITIEKNDTKLNEVRSLASKILYFTCQEGYRMDDIGVMIGNVEDYSNAVQEIFDQFDIPYFQQSKRNLSKSVLYFYITSLFSLVRNDRWNIRDVFSYLKSGFVSDKHSCDALIRYCKERGYRGTRLMRPFRDEMNIEIEQIRESIVNPVMELRKKLKANKKTDTIISFLLENGIPEKMDIKAEIARDMKLEEESRFLSQTWEAVKKVLENASILDDISLEDYLDTVETGMKSTNISVIPPTTDEVLIGDVLHTIWGGKKLMFVIGVNEGVFPYTSLATDFINQYEEEELGSCIPDFPRKITYEDQKCFIRKNLSINDSIFFSYNDENGEASYLIDRIRKLFSDVSVFEYDRTIYHKKASKINLCRDLNELKQGKITESEIISTYIYEGEDEFADVIHNLSRISRRRSISPETAAQLYGKTMRLSASRLEEYYMCPYKYFVTYGLRAKESKMFKEDQKEIGTYIHNLLEDFTRAVDDEKLDWRKLTDEDIYRLLNMVADKLIQTHNYGIFLDPRYSFMEKRIREEVIYTIKAIRYQLKDTKARIVSEEAGFGGDILKIDTPLGILNVRGRIDRIDEAQTESGDRFVRIVDYKTGEKKFVLNDLYYGVGLQLLVYMMAALNLYKSNRIDTKLLGAFYFNVSLPYIDEEKDEEARYDEYKMPGFTVDNETALRAFDRGEKKCISMDVSFSDLTKEDSAKCFTNDEIDILMDYTKLLLRKATEGIYEGRVNIEPYTSKKVDACKYCEYASICMIDGDAKKTVREKDKAQIIQNMEKRIEEELQ